MKVTRTRTVAAPVGAVWDLVSDPHSLPRWWPKVMRVEDVTGRGQRSRWTAVLETDSGSGVRADFRCTASTEGERYAWSQDLAGTAFERILTQAGLEIKLEPARAEGTSVRMTSDETLRGLSRLGGPMLRGAARRRLDEALDGIDRALVGEPAA
ncbi:MAG: SRPBCC family protein [Actinomycetota bacterium]|nr:SRPBCC family protein [Actinomycetota bacterium]